MRYVWDQFDAYFGPGRAGLATRLAARAVAPMLRRWDVASTRRVHGLIANSRFVAERIRRYWRREVDAVVHPPVDTSRFVPAAEGPAPEEYALIVSALVPYKRIELAVEAFSRLERPLWIVGDGPERQRLAKAAGRSIRFLGTSARTSCPGCTRARASSSCPGRRTSASPRWRRRPPDGRSWRWGAAARWRPSSTAGPESSSPNRRWSPLLEGIAAIDRLQPDPVGIHEEARRFDVARFRPELARAIESCLARARR